MWNLKLYQCGKTKCAVQKYSSCVNTRAAVIQTVNRIYFNTIIWPTVNLQLYYLFKLIYRTRVYCFVFMFSFKVNDIYMRDTE